MASQRQYVQPVQARTTEDDFVKKVPMESLQQQQPATNHTLLTVATVAFLLYLVWLGRRNLLSLLASRMKKSRRKSSEVV